MLPHHLEVCHAVLNQTGTVLYFLGKPTSRCACGESLSDYLSVETTPRAVLVLFLQVLQLIVMDEDLVGGGKVMGVAQLPLNQVRHDIGPVGVCVSLGKTLSKSHFCLHAVHTGRCMTVRRPQSAAQRAHTWLQLAYPSLGNAAFQHHGN